MRSHVRVVVIGGGVVGASVLYHLTKAGWTEIMLIERSELTSGSTWHAAGGMHTVNGDPNVAKLQAYTIGLYREIEAASGQAVGLHMTGGLMLAGTPERLDFLRMLRGRARCIGLDMQLLTAAEAKALYPLMDERQFVGALYNELEGHVDPAGVTLAYAKAAQRGGAEIVLRNRVVETTPRADGGWDIITEHGAVVAEHVVNCGGLWAREVGRLVGLELPVLAMEHHYLVTDDIPEVAASPHEMLHVIDFDGEIYMRQEGAAGMLIGTYERAGVPWSPQTTPWNFGQELLPNDLDRIAESLEIGFRHFPALGRAGIKRIVNGPFTFTPDGNPLVGPVRGLTKYWLACGVMAGFSQGGGVGLSLANWIVHGDPGADIWGMDAARFGDYATPAYTEAKVRETYARRFRVRFPNEEFSAGRGVKTTPIYDLLVAENAVFGAAFGLEYPVYFAPPGTEPRETYGFGRTNAFEPVGTEAIAVRQAVGLLEISTYAKYDIAGRDAARFLDRLVTNRLPKPGRTVLTPMLNRAGKLVGEFTIAALAHDKFFLVGAGVAESFHLRWFDAERGGDDVSIRAFDTDLVGLSIAGPNARRLLAHVVDDDVSDAAFPFMTIRRMAVAAVPALVGRLSYTGELGYEIWMRPDGQRRVFHALREAGRPMALRLVGARALNALRIEKGYGSWAREYRPIYSPVDAGLERFVKMDKGAFIGREAAPAERAAGGSYRLVHLAVDAADADAAGDEPILLGGDVIGWVTSGAYSYTRQTSLAMGYVRRDAPVESADYAVEILGDRRPARRLARPIFDPDGARLRSPE